MTSIFDSPDERFMTEALRLAEQAGRQDEVPIGAVIVHHNQVIARAHNQVEMLKDSTAHAEMIAITQAAAALKSKWLQECTLYVTIEPCSMCAGAIVLARLERVCFGAADPKAGGCLSVFQIADSPRLNHRANVEGGCLADACAGLVQDFFLAKRREGKTS